MKQFIRICLALVIALSAVWGTAIPVYAAIATPTTLTVNSVQIYSPYIEATDQLWIINYTIDYPGNITGDPTNGTATDLFIINIYDEGTGAITSSLPPFSLYSNGFNKGIMGFYFAAASHPTWNGSYYVKVIANSAYTWVDAPPPSTASFTHDNFEWKGYGSAIQTQGTLTTYLRTTLSNIQYVWNDSNYILVVNTAKGLALTGNGESYVTNTIYNARAYLPDLFQLSEEPMDATERTYVHTTSDNFLDTSQNTVLDVRDLAYNLTGGAIHTQNEIGMFIAAMICIGIMVIMMMVGAQFFPAFTLINFVWMGCGYIRLIHLNYAIALPIIACTLALAWKFVFQSGQY